MVELQIGRHVDQYTDLVLGMHCFNARPSMRVNPAKMEVSKKEDVIEIDIVEPTLVVMLEDVAANPRQAMRNGPFAAVLVRVIVRQGGISRDEELRYFGVEGLTGRHMNYSVPLLGTSSVQALLSMLIGWVGGKDAFGRDLYRHRVGNFSHGYTKRIGLVDGSRNDGLLTLSWSKISPLRKRAK